MRPTPESTVAATTHPSCPPSWACDTPDGAGMSAFGWFALMACGVLLLAALTGKKRT